MLLKRRASTAIAAAIAAAVGLGSTGAALAQDVSVSAQDLQALMQRLDAAEKRIKELESRDRQPAVRDVTSAVASKAKGGSLGTGAAYASDNDPIIRRLENLEGEWVRLGRSPKLQNASFIDPEDSDFNELTGRVDQIQSMLDNGFISDGTSNSTMTISGRIHGDYWAFPDHDEDLGRLDRDDNPQDRLIWRRVRFGVKGRIVDHMHYKIEMEFADPNDTQIRDLYVGWDNLPFLQTVRVGNQKRPFGLDHINSSRFNVFLERPFVIEAMNQDARRLGLVSYGVSDDQAWNWRYGFYNPELTQDDEGYTGDHYQGQIAARLANTAWWDDCTEGRSYWHWAVSGSSVWPDGNSGVSSDNEARFDTRPEARTRDDWLDTGEIAGASNYHQLGLESALNLGPVQMVGELLQTWVERDGANDVHFWGGYAYVSYFLTGEHMPWDRKTGQLARPKPFQNFFLVNTCDGCTDGGWGAWQLAARYSFADFSDEDIYGGQGESLTLGLNWLWNPNSRLQVNYIRGEITNARNRHTTFTGTPASGNYNVIGARFLVDF